MATTPRLGITEIQHNEVNGDVTFNDFLRFADFHLQPFVEDMTPATEPPSTPSNGQAWIIVTPGSWPTDALGVSPAANMIAHRYNSGWYYYTPADGWHVYDKDTNADFYFNGSTWA